MSLPTYLKHYRHFMPEWQTNAAKCERPGSSRDQWDDVVRELLQELREMREENRQLRAELASAKRAA
jgi:hypothetical protein